MGTATTSAPPRPQLTPCPAWSGGPAWLAGPAWLTAPAWLGRLVRQVAVWYAGFAVYAAGVALFSGPGLDHYWGIWGACGYAAAAVLAWRWRSARGRAAALAAALAGAPARPVARLALCAPAPPGTTAGTPPALPPT